MRLEFEVAGLRYAVDSVHAVSIAIALEFDGAQPSFFGADKAHSAPMRAGSFVGDTRQGASCNVPEIRLNPHCNGTHTESVEHIVHEAASATHSAPPLCPATLVSITPRLASETVDTYVPAFEAQDRVISRAALANLLDAIPTPWLEALVVRTLPNPAAKRSANYSSGDEPAFFTRDAVLYLRERGVQHLLVDLPSLDRTSDQGNLTAHHLFWQIEPASRRLSNPQARRQSVTELCFIPDSLKDGLYVLNLQVPAFELSVAPARPLLMSVIPL